MNVADDNEIKVLPFPLFWRLPLIGCQIFAYDHTIDAPTRRGQNIRYFKTGVGFGENLKPLSQIIAENDHRNTGIDYLKVI